MALKDMDRGELLFCPRCKDAPLVASRDIKAGERFVPVCRACNPDGDWTVEEAEEIWEACNGQVQ